MKVPTVLVDQNLYDGTQIECGLISEGYKAQTTKQGRAIRCRIYDERFVDYIVARIKQHVQRKYDNRIVLTGPPGSGKTTEAITIARLVDPDFPVENISFRLSDFRKTLSELKEARPADNYYPTAILDESGVDLYSKDWAKSHTKEMAKVFQIIRKRKLTMIMCLPHITLLTKDIRDAMHWWFDMLTLEEYRGFCVVREAIPNPFTGPWWGPLGAYVFDELDDAFWNTYEGRKDEFIDAFAAEVPITSSMRERKIKDQRDACIRELRRKKVSVRAIEKLTGLDDGGISRIGNKP